MPAMRLSNTRVSADRKRNSKFGWLTGVHRGGGYEVPIESLTGQPQGDVHRAERKALCSFWKTLSYSAPVVRLIFAASGPKTPALGRAF